MINVSNINISESITYRDTVKAVPKDTTTDNIVQADEALRVGEQIKTEKKEEIKIDKTDKKLEGYFKLNELSQEQETDKKLQEFDKKLQNIGKEFKSEIQLVNYSKPELKEELLKKLTQQPQFESYSIPKVESLIKKDEKADEIASEGVINRSNVLLTARDPIRMSKEKVDNLTKITTEFTYTKSPTNPNPPKSLLTNVKNSNHVIITSIMHKAIYTEDYLKLRASQKDLSITINQLGKQIAGSEDYLLQLGNSNPKTDEIKKAIKEVEYDLKFYVKKLQNTLKELDSVETDMKKMETDGTAKKPRDGHDMSIWEQVKKEFIDDSKSKLFMTALIDFRRQVVDSLIKEAAVEQHISLNEPRAALLVAKIVGSATQSSDRDINITMRNALVGEDTKLINAVNDKFRKIFGQDPGTFFDTNLYNEGLMPDIDKENLKTADARMEQLRDKWENPDARKVNDSKQDIVALVKERRFFSDDKEWEDYVGDTVKELKNQGVKDYSKLESIQKQYNEANSFYHDAEKKIGLKVNELRQQFPKATHVELELMASNDLYLKSMTEADKIKQSAEEIKTKKGGKGDYEMKLADYRYEMGLAHYFANEAGMSEGVLRDVVINGQMMSGINKTREENGLLPKIKFEITSHQLMESFNENLGEMLKEFNHFGNDLGAGAYHSSKYASRLSSCINDLLKDKELNLDKNDPALKKILNFTDRLLTAATKVVTVEVKDKNGKPETESIGLINIRKNEEKNIDLLANSFNPPVKGKNFEELKKNVATAIMKKELPEIKNMSDFRGELKEMGHLLNAIVRAKWPI